MYVGVHRGLPIWSAERVAGWPGADEAKEPVPGATLRSHDGCSLATYIFYICPVASTTMLLEPCKRVARDIQRDPLPRYGPAFRTSEHRIRERACVLFAIPEGLSI